MLLEADIKYQNITGFIFIIIDIKYELNYKKVHTSLKNIF